MGDVVISDAQSGKVRAVNGYQVGQTEDTWQWEEDILKETRSVGQCPRPGVEVGSLKDTPIN